MCVNSILLHNATYRVTGDQDLILRDGLPVTAVAARLNRISSHNSGSMGLTERSISVVSLDCKDSPEEPDPVPARSPSPVNLVYVTEEDRKAGASSEYENNHAYNYSTRIKANLQEKRFFPALIEVNMISIAAVRIPLECEIFYAILDFADSVSEDKKSHEKHEDLAWTNLNRAFDFLVSKETELDSIEYENLLGMLIECSKHP